MRFTFSPEQEAFRSEVNGFLKDRCLLIGTARTTR